MTMRPITSQFVDQRSIHQVYEVERFDGTNWVPAGELVLAPGATSYGGNSLGAVRYSGENQALILYGHGGEEGFAGRLNFTSEGLAFTGTTTSADGTPTALRGINREVVYHTNRRLKSDPKAPLEAWDKLKIITEWIEEYGIPTLKVVYMLGAEDISNRTRVTRVDREKGETTLEMVPHIGPGGGEDSFVIILYSGNQTFDGTYTADDATDYVWNGAVSPQAARNRLAAFQAAVNVTAAAPLHVAAASAASLSPQDLDNISSIQTVTNEKGEKIVIDWAQRICGDYFNKCLINALD